MCGKSNTKLLRLKIKEEFSNKDIIQEKERVQGKQDGIKMKVKRKRFKNYGKENIDARKERK